VIERRRKEGAEGLVGREIAPPDELVAEPRQIGAQHPQLGDLVNWSNRLTRTPAIFQASRRCWSEALSTWAPQIEEVIEGPGPHPTG